MNNNGIQYLDNLLKVYGKPSMYSTGKLLLLKLLFSLLSLYIKYLCIVPGPGSVISNSQDDMDDDTSSIYSPSTGRQKIVGRISSDGHD